MYDFNKKQKIILGIVIAIVAGFICYYVYAKEDNTKVEDNLEIQQVEEKEEGYSDDRILIHVSGAVNHEGVIELKPESRISDAIEKAGGIREDADIEDINLAYKLEDGMKVHIPTKQEKEIETPKENTENYISTSSGVTSNDNKSQTNINQSKTNINTATQAQLEMLPGIGPSTANKIIDYRKENGKFKTIEEIKEVAGIGEAKFQKIKDYIDIK